MDQEIEEGLEAPYIPPHREDSGDTNNYLEFMSPQVHDGLADACRKMLERDSSKNRYDFAWGHRHV